eukprot:RCo052076
MSLHASDSTGDASSAKEEAPATPLSQSQGVPSRSASSAPRHSSASKYHPTFETPTPRKSLIPPPGGDDLAAAGRSPAAKAPAPNPKDSPPKEQREEDKPRGPVATFFLSLRFLLAAFCVVAIFVAAFL